MIKIDIPPQEHSKKYDIPIAQETCRGCGKVVDVNVPVISKDYVGFESPIHECGEGFRVSKLKPRNPLHGFVTKINKLAKEFDAMYGSELSPEGKKIFEGIYDPPYLVENEDSDNFRSEYLEHIGELHNEVDNE